MGPSSACLNDLNNDDFVQILHIDEGSDDESDEKPNDYDNPTLSMNSNLLGVPESMKQNASDVSISYILDNANDNDFNGFQSMENHGHRIRSSSLNVPEIRQAASDYSISHILDQVNNNSSFHVQDTGIAKSENSLVIQMPESRTSSSDRNIPHILEYTRPRSNSDNSSIPTITVDSGSTTTTPKEIKSQISFFLDEDNLNESNDHNTFVNDTLRPPSSRAHSQQQEQNMLSIPQMVKSSSSDTSISNILDQV